MHGILLMFILFSFPSCAGSDGSSWHMHTFHYVLHEQLTCSFLNPSDISSAGGGGGSPAVPTVGRTSLPSPAGTQPWGAHPARGAAPGQLAQLPNKLAACVQLHAVLPKFLILTASPPALITLELEIVHTNFLEWHVKGNACYITCCY